MKKLLLFILFPLLAHTQVGIATLSPNNSLSTNGSFAAKFIETTSNYTMTGTDFYIVYNGTGTATITLPPVGTGTTSFTGRIYKIKNTSPVTITVAANGTDKLRPTAAAPVNTYALASGAYVEVVNNKNSSGGNTWDLPFSASYIITNVETYGTQLLIPTHGQAYWYPVADWTNHTNSSFDTTNSSTDIWWLISKTSTSSNLTSTSKTQSGMVLVYEYQGTPFNLANMYVSMCAGNNSNYPDVYNPSLISIANDGTGGKTRISIKVSRVDTINTNASSTSNWSGTFLLNVLLSRKIY